MQRLLEAIAVTAELTQTDLSKAAAKVMAEDLARYPLEQVLGALTRCRRELRGKLTIADVIQRLDDGRPGVEEAWAMVPQDEARSVVWTQEMASAFGVALPLLDDPVAARMAFKEAYLKAVATARDQGLPPQWTPSLGHDPYGRESALMEAVEKGRMKLESAQRLLPHLQASPEFEKLMAPEPVVKRITPLLEKPFSKMSDAQRAAEAELEKRGEII